MILERTQSVFGRSLVQVFKIANSKSFLKSKAIKTKKIRSTVVEGNYFRSKKNNSSSYHANFLSQVIISRFKRSRMLDLEIQKKNHYYNYIWSRKSYEMLFVFTLYSEYKLFFPSCFYCRYVYSRRQISNGYHMYLLKDILFNFLDMQQVHISFILRDIVYYTS